MSEENVEDQAGLAARLNKELQVICTKYAKDGLSPFHIKCSLIEGVLVCLMMAHRNGVLTARDSEQSFEDTASEYLADYVARWCEENEDALNAAERYENKDEDEDELWKN